MKNKSDKIHWRDVPNGAKPKLDKNIWTVRGKTVFWHGGEQQEAHSWLLSWQQHGRR